MDAAYVESTAGLLPGTRFAVDAYVHFVRDRSVLEAVASSLTEMFSPSIIAERVSGMLSHYDFITEETLAYFTPRLTQAPLDVNFALSYVKQHARTREQQDLVLDALRFKCGVLWSQLDALHFAYVAPGVIPPGAFVPDVTDEAAIPRFAPGVRMRRTKCAAAGSCWPRSGCSCWTSMRWRSCTWSTARAAWGAIVDDLAARYDADARADRGRCGGDAAGSDCPGCDPAMIPPPLGLLAELTHRCPLQCPYCANPLEMDRASAELDTATWQRVLTEAAELGVLQIHFSGGEPTVRRDLLDLVRHANAAQLYSNLITSGVTLTGPLLVALRTAGLDHIQLSFQDSEHEGGDRIGGMPGGHARKRVAARLIREAGFPLTANFVVHRQNLARLPAMIALGEAMGAGRIEIAHVQYYGWGLLNRDALLPTPAQIDEADAIVAVARDRLQGRLVIDYVTPDYYAARPKSCMGGWGRQGPERDPPPAACCRATRRRRSRT